MTETTQAKRHGRGQARPKLLETAMRLVRQTGFEAMRVDDLCKAAGVTKGAFFHHFASKEALGIALGEHWTQFTGALFAGADYHNLDDPLDRIFAYINLRHALVQGTIDEYTCVVGTMVQELHATSPGIRDACGHSIFDHAEKLEPHFAEAIKRHGLTGADAASLARHTQAVIQGSFILAKAGGGQAAVHEALDHLTRYLECLFGRSAEGIRN